MKDFRTAGKGTSGDEDLNPSQTQQLLGGRRVNGFEATDSSNIRQESRTSPPSLLQQKLLQDSQEATNCGRVSCSEPFWVPEALPTSTMGECGSKTLKHPNPRIIKPQSCGPRISW